MMAIQYGDVTGGDFMENELHITMESDTYYIKYSKVAIIEIESISEQLALEEFYKQLKNK